MIPKDIEWTKEDWEDYYLTLRRFKMRFLRRHGKVIPEIAEQTEFLLKQGFDKREIARRLGLSTAR